MAKLLEQEFVVDTTGTKWKILESYPDFDEYVKNRKNAKQGERERFSILLILFNMNRFTKANLLKFIPDYKLSQLFDKL